MYILKECKALGNLAQANPQLFPTVTGYSIAYKSYGWTVPYQHVPAECLNLNDPENEETQKSKRA